MLEPKKIAEMDQAQSLLVEVLPRLWRQLFDGLVKEWFSEDRAMELLKAHVGTWKFIKNT